MIKDIILYIVIVLLVASNIFLYIKMYKINKVENFAVSDDVKQAINDIYKADINAIRNLSNVATEIYNNNDSFTIPANKTTVTDLTTNGNVSVLGTLNIAKDTTASTINASTINASTISASTISANTLSSSTISASTISASTSTTNKLCIGSTCLEENDLKKLLPYKTCAGFAVDGLGTTMLLYEGTWDVAGIDTSLDARFNAWTGNVWDCAYINKGWKCRFFKRGDKNSLVYITELENKTELIPRRVSFYGGAENTVTFYIADWVGY
jgi:hypothetical protein